MTVRVIDIETTGTDPTVDAIIEIASVVLLKDGAIANQRTALVRPPLPVPPESSAVHHLIDEDLAFAPELDEVLEQFRGPMPTRARREATALGMNLEFRIDDMRSLSTAPIHAYDAVIAMDNAVPHLQSDADIKTAFAAMRKRLRNGGTLLISMRDYGSLIAHRAPSTLPAFYRDGQSRRIVHQVWDWLDDRRYVLHLFITMEKPDSWRTLHFVGHYRAIPVSDVAALVDAAGFDDVRVLAPGETGHYQPVIRAVAPRASPSD